jgi:hypothetical protein
MNDERKALITHHSSLVIYRFSIYCFSIYRSSAIVHRSPFMTFLDSVQAEAELVVEGVDVCLAA